MTPTQKWYVTPLPQQELDRLLTTSCLKDAVGILQNQAKPRMMKSADPVTVALAYAQLVGYQKAIDDLIALSAPKNTKPLSALPTEWSHLNPQTES